MSWRDTWRLRAHEWIRRLNRVSAGWYALQRRGLVKSEAIGKRRKLLRRVRDWMYVVINTYLGGVDKLPNRLTPLPPLGELGAIGIPQLAIGGAVVVTAMGIAAYIANHEARLVQARAELLDAESRRVNALAKAASETDDPAMRAELAKAVNNRDLLRPDEDEGIAGWKVGLGVAGVAAAVVLARRARLHAREGDSMADIIRSRLMFNVKPQAA